MRVLSAATRAADGGERAWVVDASDVDVTALARALDGVLADAWNATFDARVTDRDVFSPAGYGRQRGIRWWDAQPFASERIGQAPPRVRLLWPPSASAMPAEAGGQLQTDVA